MNESQLKIIIFGINSKIKHGKNLEDILSSYTKLTEDEKQYIRDQIN